MPPTNRNSLKIDLFSLVNLLSKFVASFLCGFIRELAVLRFGFFFERKQWKVIQTLVIFHFIII